MSTLFAELQCYVKAADAAIDLVAAMEETTTPHLDIVDLCLTFELTECKLDEHKAFCYTMCKREARVALSGDVALNQYLDIIQPKPDSDEDEGSDVARLSLESSHSQVIVCHSPVTAQ